MKLQTSFKYTVYQNTFLYENKNRTMFDTKGSQSNFFFQEDLIGYVFNAQFICRLNSAF